MFRSWRMCLISIFKMWLSRQVQKDKDIKDHRRVQKDKYVKDYRQVQKDNDVKDRRRAQKDKYTSRIAVNPGWHERLDDMAKNGRPMLDFILYKKCNAI